MSNISNNNIQQPQNIITNNMNNNNMNNDSTIYSNNNDNNVIDTLKHNSDYTYAAKKDNTIFNNNMRKNSTRTDFSSGINTLINISNNTNNTSEDKNSDLADFLNFFIRFINGNKGTVKNITLSLPERLFKKTQAENFKLKPEICKNFCLKLELKGKNSPPEQIEQIDISLEIDLLLHSGEDVSVENETLINNKKRITFLNKDLTKNLENCKLRANYEYNITYKDSSKKSYYIDNYDELKIYNTETSSLNNENEVFIEQPIEQQNSLHKNSDGEKSSGFIFQSNPVIFRNPFKGSLTKVKTWYKGLSTGKKAALWTGVALGIAAASFYLAAPGLALVGLAFAGKGLAWLGGAIAGGVTVGAKAMGNWFFGPNSTVSTNTSLGKFSAPKWDRALAWGGAITTTLLTAVGLAKYTSKKPQGILTGNKYPDSTNHNSNNGNGINYVD